MAAIADYLQLTIEDTKRNIEKKQSMTLDEILASIEAAENPEVCAHSRTNTHYTLHTSKTTRTSSHKRNIEKKQNMTLDEILASIEAAENPEVCAHPRTSTHYTQAKQHA